MKRVFFISAIDGLLIGIGCVAILGIYALALAVPVVVARVWSAKKCLELDKDWE